MQVKLTISRADVEELVKAALKAKGFNAATIRFVTVNAAMEAIEATGAFVELKIPVFGHHKNGPCRDAVARNFQFESAERDGRIG